MILHKFRCHKISKDTNYLIIGTFNPDIDDKENNAEFFYSRKVKRHNHMWTILPRVFPTEGYSDLAGADKSAKLAFMAQTGVDFIDVVESISISNASKINFSDTFLEEHEPRFRNVVAEIERISPRAVCFTRKTLGGIPRIAKEVHNIEEYCKRRKIPFKALPSPSPRHGIESKIREWSEFLLNPQSALARTES